MVNDIIGDTLTRIRNAQQRGKDFTIVLNSNTVKELLKVLTKENYLLGFEENTEDKNTLKVNLRYVNGEPVMYSIKRVSKPGWRKYIGYKDIRKVKEGVGLQILTTSNGVMSARQARQEKVGGEILCEIW